MNKSKWLRGDVQKTYLANKICVCEKYNYEGQDNVVKIDPLSETWPLPSTCGTCNKYRPDYVYECVDCKQVFYRWFRFALATEHKGPACWGCLVNWYRNAVSSSRELTPEMGFQKPPDELAVRPRDMSDIEADLDDLFSSLG